MIKVVVAEDSAVQRDLLFHLLTRDPDLDVVAVARDGVEAIELVRLHRPDVVVMDVHMPRMGGYEATRAIMAELPLPIVMVSACGQPDEVRMSFDALQAGALALIAKPSGPDLPDHAPSADRLRTTVRLMANVDVVTRRRSVAPSAAVAPPASHRRRRIELVAIGASTGGPSVIAEILSGLPSELSVSVLIVQHMAPGFADGFVQWLGTKTSLAVSLASAGDPILPGRLYLAPDGRQMGVTRDRRIELRPGPPRGGFCPSVTDLFESVADIYGRAAMGVVLTGMGRDGADGLLRLRQAGGVTVAQDAASCVVFGMPREAIAIGAIDSVLRPDQIAAAIGSMAI